MKSIVALLLVILLANKGIEARRELTNSVRASATAFATDGGSARASASATGTGKSDSPTSAEAVAVADGCNAKSTSEADAKDGAEVGATTRTKSEDCAEVEGKTVVKGEGEDADVKVETDVKSDKPIDVTVFVKRVDDGEKVETIAIELVDSYEGKDYKRVAESLLGLAGGEKTFPLFERALIVFVEKKACKGFKLVIAGFEDRFSQYTLPGSVSKCLTASCSNYDNAKHCCGEAQLKQDKCACKGGTCAWVNPEKKNGVYSWTCNDCGFDVKTCSCA